MLYEVITAAYVPQAMAAIRAFVQQAQAGFMDAVAYTTARQTVIDQACGGDAIVFFAAWNQLLAQGDVITSYSIHYTKLYDKMKNPLFKAGSVPLVWDGDLNPEGFALAYKSGGFFATGAGFSVEERGSTDDSLLYTVQAGYKFPLGDTTSLTAGAGYS